MTRGKIAGGALAAGLVLLVLAAGYRALERDVPPVGAAPAAPAALAASAAPSPAETPSGAGAAPAGAQGFLYGRVTTVDGATYEGRLRWGRGEEAFWGDFFNGFKDHNPWAALVPPEKLPKERSRIEIFGLEIARRERPASLGRFFMARFGDIRRVEARGREVRVTLKSGAAADLNRLEASDFDDDVRVWDARRGIVDLDSLRIRAIDFLPTGPLGEAPYRLYGTVRTRQGDFTGFVAWNREKSVGTDELVVRGAEGERTVRLDAIRSIARRSGDSLATLVDSRELVLSEGGEAGQGTRGIYVDDRRYGRVLVSWDAFERLDLNPGGGGPAYGDFPPGTALAGSVIARDGRRLSGRLVYDLDESETTETLDAPSRGVDYTIPFGLIGSIASIGAAGREGTDAEAKVTLRSGEELRLERKGDLGEGNAGLLIFVDGAEVPEYLPWAEVERIDFDRPPAMYPPL